MKHAFAIIVLLTVMPLKGQNDTTHIPYAPMVGGTLVATGAVFTFTPLYSSVAIDVRDAVVAQGWTPIDVDDYLQFLPAVTPLALSVCGLKGRHGTGKMTLMTGAVMLSSMGIIHAMKPLFGIRRPDGDGMNSFPSGHTYMAFAGAELLRKEYGSDYPWMAIAGYTIATLVGLMRVRNNRHWVGDVLAGAGLGMLTTNLVYWVIDK